MKIILACLIMMTGLATAQGQTYYPFPSANAIWTQRVGHGDSTPVYECYGLMNSDTTVNAMSYHRLYRSADTIFTANELIGGIREDGSRKVFFYEFSKGNERMLFDFSVQVGDTVLNLGPIAIVDHIDSVVVGGSYHRRINFRMPGGSQWPRGSWVEGMGNYALGGLLNSAMLQPTCDCASDIICFKQNNGWAYHNPQYTSTNCVNNALAVKPINKAGISVSIYPNPVTGNSTLRVDGLNGKAGLGIYSFTGALVHNYTLSGSGTININNSNIPAGMYYYMLTTVLGTTISGRFTVQ